MTRVAAYIVEREPEGIDSIHIACRAAALVQGWTVLEPAVGPSYELWFRLCPICGESFTANAPKPAEGLRDFEMRPCKIHRGVLHMHRKVCGQCQAPTRDGATTCGCGPQFGTYWRCHRIDRSLQGGQDAQT